MGKLDIPPADTLTPDQLNEAADLVARQAKGVHVMARDIYQRDSIDTGSARDQAARDEWSRRQGGQAAEMQARRELKNSKDALERARHQDDLAQKAEQSGNLNDAEEARENAVAFRAIADVATER